MPIVRFPDGTLVRPPQKRWALFLLVLGLCMPSLAVAQAYPRIAVIIWDGMPQEFLNNPEYAPLWNSEVRSTGAFVPMVMDAVGCAPTFTPPAHATISSGTCQHDLGIEGDDRSTMPLLTELLRKQWDLGYNDVAFLSGKYRLRMMDYSVHSEYGPAYAAWFDYRLNMFEYDGDDSQVRQMVHEYEDIYHPQVLGIDFAGTDRIFHRCLGNWERGLAGMHTTDAEVRDMVAYLRFQGYDHIIVTTDHGRHLDELRPHGPGSGHADDCRPCVFVYAQMTVLEDMSWRTPDVSSNVAEQALALATKYGEELFDCADGQSVGSDLGPYGGWMNHGENCSRCQDVWFWITGPGIVNGEYSVVREPIDILPTLAALVGFEAPYAEGVVMNEILLNPVATSVSASPPVNSTWGNVKSLYK